MSRARKRALLGTICRQAITLSSTTLAALEMKPLSVLHGKTETPVFVSCFGGRSESETRSSVLEQGVGCLGARLVPAVVLRTWEGLPLAFHPYLTLLDTSGHNKLVMLLQDAHLPLHGEDGKLENRAYGRMARSPLRG